MKILIAFNGMNTEKEHDTIVPNFVIISKLTLNIKIKLSDTQGSLFERLKKHVTKYLPNTLPNCDPAAVNRILNFVYCEIDSVFTSITNGKDYTLRSRHSDGIFSNGKPFASFTVLILAPTDIKVEYQDFYTFYS